MKTIKAILWFFQTLIVSLFSLKASPSPIAKRFLLPSSDPRVYSVEERIQRGHTAKVLLESPVARDILNDLRGEIYEKWLDGKSVEVREECHRVIQLMDRFQADLQSILTTGEAAEMALQEPVRRVA